MQDPLALLPPHLAERSRRLNRAAGDGAYILYWMRTALRTEENPALDAALVFGDRFGLPVLVYQGLSERYPHASDRHHRFILEGALDVARDLGERGIAHVLHVERAGHRGPHLITLASAARVVVTEDLPVRPLVEWSRSLAERVPTAVLAVDTACLVPMASLPAAPERAFEFRRRTESARRRALGAPWPEAPEPVSGAPWTLPFDPVGSEADDLAGLIAQCQIDHGVAPVPATPGGGRAARARWDRFKEAGLRTYHRRRNDPLVDGVSRMSAYLHYGMISPFRVAREAAADGSAGAEKYLDELLVWRELAHAFCFHRADHRRLSALPEWARRTLAEHADDPRPGLLSWERLAGARSGDALWDATQRSLVRHGELHNNLRMTWGKALLDWTPDAARALALLEDLNHRFALDGRDPASYGGILWCLGQFDRPFDPPRPILGRVRERSTRRHAARLDVERYARQVARPAFAEAPRVLVIGAGLAGLSCARALKEHGIAVDVVDKGRGPGGRASTRRREGWAFDHGAQYLTCRDARVRPFVDAWLEEGVLAPWEGRFGRFAPGGGIEPLEPTEPRLVGAPKMSTLVRHLGEDLDVRYSARVERLEGGPGAWTPRWVEGAETDLQGPYDVVVVAVPPVQAGDLLDGPGAAAAPALREALNRVEVAPCAVALVGFPEPLAGRLDLPFDGIGGDGALAWAARNGSKPGRGAGEAWVLHAGIAWSRDQLDEEPDVVARRLVRELEAATGLELPEPAFLQGHRWRYARTTRPAGVDCLAAASAGLYACGDWCLGARMELAFSSGRATAGRILGALEAPVAATAPRQGSLFS